MRLRTDTRDRVDQNYPYLTNPAMKYAADSCHANGMKYSVYNTMRELSDRCTEYWPLLSFNETLVPGSGKGGADWLQEHIRTGYLPAWSNPVSSVSSPHTPNPDPAEGPYLQDAGMRVKVRRLGSQSVTSRRKA